MKRVAPRRAYSRHASPMPRTLNEPGGCVASIFSQTVLPDSADKAADSTSGVSICSGEAPACWFIEIEAPRRML